MLHLYNTLTRTKEKFIPIDNKKVKMYVCGITPYDTTHLGHAFTYVSFDALVRYLQYKGYEVIYTQNVTDIDDDILRKAKQENRDWRKLGDFWTKKFLSDMKSLNVLPPTYYVRATDAIDTMVGIIEDLINKQVAYQKDGNVYFEIKKYSEYGKLSHFNHTQMTLISKERGGNPDDPLKKDPLDFLLWQKTKPDEPFWESPWGKGRPGWHIECSSMIKNYLGDQIDIHGGGRDLVFPHHESEIAQSECNAQKKPFVKFWVHTAMVLYQGEKMAKSLGNLVMVSNLLKYNNANEIKWLLLSHHYRKPWEFDQKELQESEKAIELVSKALKIKSEGLGSVEQRYTSKFISYMDDDLNIPKALILITNLAKRILKEPKTSNTNDLKSILKNYLSILGLVL